MKLKYESKAAPYGSSSSGSDGRITVSESNIAVGLKQQLESFNFDAALFLDPIIQSSFSQGDSHVEVLLLSLFEDLTRKFASLSRDIEDDIIITSEAVTAADSILLEEVQQHTERLDGAEQFVASLKQNFDKASAGAVAIGERLATVEKERARVASAMEWMDYIKLFEQAPADLFNDLHLMNIDSLRGVLPSQMQDMTWGQISKLLFEMRRVLSDINSDEVLTAQKNVIRLTEAIEIELLGEFEVAITALMDFNSEGGQSTAADAGDPVRKARQLAEWLQLYNNGQSLQKRYILSVVEKRIPKALLMNKKSATVKHTNIKDVKNLTDVKNILNEQKDTITTLFQPKSKVKAHGKRVNSRNQPSSGGDGDNESVSSGGASDSEGFAVDHDGGPLSGKFDSAEGIFPEDSLEVTLTPAPVLAPNPLFDNKKKRMSFFGAKKAAPTRLLRGTSAAIGAANVLNTVSCMDQLSLLFANISAICQEQFTLIRQVFPTVVVGKITRLLVQRIFIDPLFGIQVRIDQVLCPPPPLPPLGLAEYLQALTTVREKLSSLYTMLLEYCVPPDMSAGAGGMVSGGFVNIVNSPSKVRPFASSEGVAASDAVIGTEVMHRMRAEIEVREFLQDQINTVLSAYITDYFDKELTNLKFQFSEALRTAADDPLMLTSVSVFGSLPQLRPEKMKSIEDVVRKIVNVRFVNKAIDISTESANRMISVGRDDKRLPLQLKEIYLLLAEFLLDNVLCTCMGAFINMLLKQLAAKPQQSQPPPLEVIVAMAASYPAMAKLKTHFDEIFQPQLETQPNAATVCKECRQDLSRKLEKIMQETLCAYGICVATHIEKLLQLHQAKSDYNPSVIVQNITAGGSKAKIIVSSNACNNVCQVLHTVATMVKFYEADLLRLNVADAMFKPIGQHVVGILVSHIRKQRVSIEGARVLIKDCEEYRNTSSKLESPEVIDMFTCLRDVSLAFQTPPERVFKKAIEELRHVDIPVLLGLLHARADASAGIGIGRSWFEQLEIALSYKKPSTQNFVWEAKGGYSLMAFADILAGKTILGPPTLRRAGAQLSALLLQEGARALEAKLSASDVVGAINSSEKEGEGARNSFTGGSGAGISGASSNLFNRFSQFAPSQNKQQVKGQYNASVPPATQSGSGLSFARPDLIGSAQQTKEKIDASLAQTKEKLDNTAKEVAMAFDRFGGNIKGGFDKLGIGLGLGRASAAADTKAAAGGAAAAAGSTHPAPPKSTMRAGPPPKLPPQNKVYKKNNGFGKLF